MAMPTYAGLYTPYFPTLCRARRVCISDGGDRAREAEGLQRGGGADHVRGPNLRRIKARVGGDRVLLDWPRIPLFHYVICLMAVIITVVRAGR